MLKIDNVEVVRSVRASQDDPVPTEVQWTFDFEGVTKEHLVKLAIESLTIKAQAAWRRAHKKGESSRLSQRTWKVADMVSQTRERVSKVEKASRLAEGMTKEERTAAIAALMALDED